MIPISNAFRAELDQIIRRRGRCQVLISYESGGSGSIEEDNVQKIEFHGTGDPLSRQLPTEECTLSAIDLDHEWDPAYPGSLYEETLKGAELTIRIGIETESGTVEWSEWVRYHINGAVVWKNNIATFKGIRDLARLGNTFHQMNWTDSNLGQLAASVSMAQELGSDTDYYVSCDIDPELYEQAVLDNAVLPENSVKDSLLSIAVAGCATLKTNHNGVVYLRDYWSRNPEVNPCIIRADDIMEQPSVEVLPYARYENITYLSDVADSETRMTDVLKASGATNITASDEPLYLRFDSPILASSFLFSSQTNIRELEFNLYRTGIEITKLTRTNSSANWSMTGRAEKAETVSTTKSIDFLMSLTERGTEDEELSGPLLNNHNYMAVAAFRLGYLRYTRYLYSFPYRGDPSIEPLDIIRIELLDGTVKKFIVVDHTFTYQNGFSGKIAARRIDVERSEHNYTGAVSDFAVSDYAVSDEG